MVGFLSSLVKTMTGTFLSFMTRFAIRPIRPSFISVKRQIPDRLSKTGKVIIASLVRFFLSSFVEIIHSFILIISSDDSLVKYLTRRLIEVSSCIRPIELIFGAISNANDFSVIKEG